MWANLGADFGQCIENRWCKMQYERMRFISRDAQTLNADVQEVVAGFGERYALEFCQTTEESIAGIC
jgi:hypothetical protein